MAEVEQRFGAPDLPEIDQAGVAVIGAEYRCHVEVAVLQDRGSAAAGALMVDEFVEDGEAGVVEQGCQRAGPWAWKEAEEEGLVLPILGR